MKNLTGELDNSKKFKKVDFLVHVPYYQQFKQPQVMRNERLRIVEKDLKLKEKLAFEGRDFVIDKRNVETRGSRRIWRVRVPLSAHQGRIFHVAIVSKFLTTESPVDDIVKLVYLNFANWKNRSRIDKERDTITV